MPKSTIESPPKDSSTNILENYAQGNYELGIQKLLEQKSSMNPALFHYNLGSFFLKKGDFGIARFHFLQARKLGMQDSFLDHNLNLSRSELFNQDRDQWDLLSKSKDFFLTYPKDLFISFFLIVVLCLSFMLKRMAKQRLVFLLLILAAAAPLAIHQYVVTHYQKAVALQEVLIREGPSSVFQQSSQARIGSEMIIRPFKGKWVKVVAPDFLSGWASISNLGVISYDQEL